MRFSFSTILHSIIITIQLDIIARTAKHPHVSFTLRVADYERAVITLRYTWLRTVN